MNMDDYYVSVMKVVHTTEPIDLLQHTEIHPVPIDRECGSTLHKLCGSSIIKGSAIDCHSAGAGEFDHGQSNPLIVCWTCQQSSGKSPSSPRSYGGTYHSKTFDHFDILLTL